MSSDRRPGPAYSLQQTSPNGIVDAQHYITTFVLALIIQDYIKNMSELIVTGITTPMMLLLSGGLLVLLVFTFESYTTAVARTDPLHREDVLFEILRAVSGLFALFGLHNFSLILTRLSAESVTAAAVASQFGWGLAVVYTFYLIIRLVVTAQNRKYGEAIKEQRLSSLGVYLIYALFWSGYALAVSRLSNWAIVISFIAAATTSLIIYIWLWRDRYKMLAGIDSTPEDG